MISFLLKNSRWESFRKNFSYYSLSNGALPACFVTPITVKLSSKVFVIFWKIVGLQFWYYDRNFRWNSFWQFDQKSSFRGKFRMKKNSRRSWFQMTNWEKNKIFRVHFLVEAQIRKAWTFWDLENENFSWKLFSSERKNPKSVFLKKVEILRILVSENKDNFFWKKILKLFQNKMILSSFDTCRMEALTRGKSLWFKGRGV